jgi:putative oxidoreductase
MLRLLDRLTALLAAIPHDLIALIARISVGTVFLRSGLLKLEGWADGTTVALFRDEYQVPLLSPEVAAVLAMSAELTLPWLLFVGLGTRLAALALLAMTAMIQLFVYPNAYDTHGTWAVCFLYLMKFGAGRLSLDHLLSRVWGARTAAA